jgi:hypothetical protein
MVSAYIQVFFLLSNPTQSNDFRPLQTVLLLLVTAVCALLKLKDHQSLSLLAHTPLCLE